MKSDYGADLHEEVYCLISDQNAQESGTAESVKLPMGCCLAKCKGQKNEAEDKGYSPDHFITP